MRAVRVSVPINHAVQCILTSGFNFLSDLGSRRPVLTNTLDCKSCLFCSVDAQYSHAVSIYCVLQKSKRFALKSFYFKTALLSAGIQDPHSERFVALIKTLRRLSVTLWSLYSQMNFNQQRYGNMA